MTTKLWIQDAGYESAKKALERSLQRLQLEANRALRPRREMLSDCSRMTCSNLELDAWMPPRTRTRQSGVPIGAFCRNFGGFG